MHRLSETNPRLEADRLEGLVVLVDRLRVFVELVMHLARGETTEE